MKGWSRGYLEFNEYGINNRITRIENTQCAASNCNRLATKSIIFELGFSARFCDICSKDIVSKNLGKMEG
jgi:hypothetical protein